MSSRSAAALASLGSPPRAPPLCDCRRVKEARGLRHAEQVDDLPGAARLPEDHDARRIAAERLDVVAHPSQRRDDVLLSRVGRLRELAAEDPAEVQVAENVEAMIDAHADHVVIARQVLAGVAGRAAAALVVAAAVEPDHDRALAAVAEAARPHVQVEAVLALSPGGGRPQRSPEHDLLVAAGATGLRSVGTVLERVAHAGPRRFAQRRQEPALAAGRRAVGHTQESVDAVLDLAAEATRAGRHGFRLRQVRERVARAEPAREDECGPPAGPAALADQTINVRRSRLLAPPSVMRFTARSSTGCSTEGCHSIYREPVVSIIRVSWRWPHDRLSRTRPLASRAASRRCARALSVSFRGVVSRAARARRGSGQDRALPRHLGRGAHLRSRRSKAASTPWGGARPRTAPSSSCSTC